MKKHNYEAMKTVNIICGIAIGIVLLASFVNTDSISAMFGINGNILYFIGHNILWIIPLIILIRNLIVMPKTRKK